MTTIEKIADEMWNYPEPLTTLETVRFVVERLKEPPSNAELMIDAYFNYPPLSGFGKIIWQNGIDIILDEK